MKTFDKNVSKRWSFEISTKRNQILNKKGGTDLKKLRMVWDDTPSKF